MGSIFFQKDKCVPLDIRNGVTQGSSKILSHRKLAMLFSKRTPEASSTVLPSTAGYYSTQIGGLVVVRMTVSQEGVRASYLGEASVAQCCVQKSRTVRDSNPWY